MCDKDAYRQQLKHLLQGSGGASAANAPAKHNQAGLNRSAPPHSRGSAAQCRQPANPSSKPARGPAVSSRSSVPRAAAAKAPRERVSAKAPSTKKLSPGPKTPPKRFLPLVLKPAQEDDPASNQAVAKQLQECCLASSHAPSGLDEGSPPKKAKPVSAVDRACSPICFPATPVHSSKQLAPQLAAPAHRQPLTEARQRSGLHASVKAAAGSGPSPAPKTQDCRCADVTAGTGHRSHKQPPVAADPIPAGGLPSQVPQEFQTSPPALAPIYSAEGPPSRLNKPGASAANSGHCSGDAPDADPGFEPQQQDISKATPAAKPRKVASSDKQENHCPDLAGVRTPISKQPAEPEGAASPDLLDACSSGPDQHTSKCERKAIEPSSNQQIHSHQVIHNDQSTRQGRAGWHSSSSSSSSPICAQRDSSTFVISSRPSPLLRSATRRSSGLSATTSRCAQTRRPSRQSSSDFDSPVCTQRPAEESPASPAVLQTTPQPKGSGPASVTPASTAATMSPDEDNSMQPYARRLSPEPSAEAAGSPMCISPALEAAAGPAAASTTPPVHPQPRAEVAQSPGFSPMLPSPASSTPAAGSPAAFTPHAQQSAQQAHCAQHGSLYGCLDNCASMDMTSGSRNENDMDQRLQELDSAGTGSGTECQPQVHSNSAGMQVDPASPSCHINQASLPADNTAGFQVASRSAPAEPDASIANACADQPVSHDILAAKVAMQGLQWPADSLTPVSSEYEAPAVAAAMAAIGQTGTPAMFMGPQVAGAEYANEYAASLHVAQQPMFLASSLRRAASSPPLADSGRAAQQAQQAGPGKGPPAPSRLSKTTSARQPTSSSGYAMFGSISTYSAMPLAPPGSADSTPTGDLAAEQATSAAQQAAAERLAEYQRLLQQASAGAQQQQWPQHSAAAAQHSSIPIAQQMPAPTHQPVDYLAAYYAALGKQPPPRAVTVAPVQGQRPPPATAVAAAPVQRPTGVSCPAHAAKVYTTFVWQRDAIAFADRCNRAAAGLPEEEPCAAETSMRPPGNPAADLACHAEPAVTGETQPGTGVGVFYRSSDAETQEPPGSRRLDEIVKVFCQERGGERGYHRQFVAASHAALWARCNALPPQDRHYYEVIKEGSPCHLYFDLEYATACNADVDGDALVEKLLCMVSQRLKQEWGFDMQPDWVVELDSSSATKFSRHLTIRIPGHAFPNNHAIGCLVSQLLASSEAMQLMVRKGGADEAAHTFTSFVDSAVYTKNRHFRIIWNSKGGKTATLVPTERFATAPGHGMSRQQLFLESLICNVPPTARLLHVDGSNTTLTGSRAAGTAHPLRTCLPVSPGRAGSSVKVVRLCDEGEQAPEGLSLQRVQAWAEAAKGFVEQMARQRAGGQPATARTIAHCGLAGTVAYSMIGPGSHYCENIGRCHQSNHVYYVVNFVEGAYAQKCHDPDCSSFRSAWMPLPAELRLT